MTDDDRADRLRRSRRTRTHDDADDEGDSTDTPDEPREQPQSDAATGVKENTAVIMYLPDDLAEQLDIRFDELKAAYRRETGEKLEKNREYYPTIVQNGLESIDVQDVIDE